MNVLVDIGHPAHVHVFRHAMHTWQKEGHRVHIVARDIPIARRLLEAFGFSYEVISRKRTGVIGLGIECLVHGARLCSRIRKWSIDVCVAVGGTFTVHAAWLNRVPCTVFYDTETARIANKITFPFAKAVVTPKSFPQALGHKHVIYDGFQELAYLHPTYFKPMPGVLEKYGLSETTPFYVLRFISWEASHDLGLKPASMEQKKQIVEHLQRMGRVVLIPEGKADDEFKHLALDVAPEDFHQLLYHAAACVSEGSTTALECSVLGTPALYISPVHPAAVLDMARHGLLTALRPDEGVAKAVASLEDGQYDTSITRKQASTFASDYDDVTDLIVTRVLMHANGHKR